MKTVIRITNDYQSALSYELRNEDIEYLLNELGDTVHVEISNSDYFNPAKTDGDPEDFAKVKTIVARGYCKGDWQEYTVYYSCEDDNQYLQQLVQHLERTFTHQNNYWVEKFERATIDGKTFDANPHDYTSFCVTHIEFPSEDDVLKEYVDIYGKDFDEYEIKID